MNPTREQLDEEFRRKVHAARLMSPDEKVRMGFRLFKEECAAARERIRRENPGVDDERVEQILNAELEAERRTKDEIIRSGLLP